MTNTTTNAQTRAGRSGDSRMPPGHAASPPRAELAPSFADEETLALDGLVIDIELLGAFEPGKRTKPAAE
jgi:hypothetical protein